MLRRIAGIVRVIHQRAVRASIELWFRHPGRKNVVAAYAIILALAAGGAEISPVSAQPVPANSSESARVTAARFPFGFFNRSSTKAEEMKDPFQQTSAEVPIDATPPRVSISEVSPPASIPTSRVPTSLPPRLLPRRVANNAPPMSAAPAPTSNGNVPVGYPEGGRFSPLPANSNPAGVSLGPDVGVVENEIWGTTAGANTNGPAGPPPPGTLTATQPTNATQPSTAEPPVASSPAAQPLGSPPVDVELATRAPVGSSSQVNPGAGLGDYDPAARVLALVGDQPILAGDLLGHINERLKQYEGQVPREELDRAREIHLQQLLPGAIDNKMAAIDFLRKIPVEKIPEIEERAYKNFSETKLPDLLKKSGAKTAAELDGQLRLVGSSLDKMRRLHTEQIMAQAAYGQNVVTDYEPTLAEMLDDYRRTAAEYEVKERVKWEQLMVRFDRSSSPKDAWRELAEMGNEVKGGAPWAAVAQRRSHGPTASAGGLYDWTNRGTLTSSIVEDTVFTLPAGQMSRMFKDDDGFHIVRVIEHQPPSRVEFHEVQDSIRKKLIEAHREQEIVKYLAQLRKKTYIWNVFDQGAKSAGENQVARPPAPPLR